MWSEKALLLKLSWGLLWVTGCVQWLRCHMLPWQESNFWPGNKAAKTKQNLKNWEGDTRPFIISYINHAGRGPIQAVG